MFYLLFINFSIFNNFNLTVWFRFNNWSFSSGYLPFYNAQNVFVCFFFGSGIFLVKILSIQSHNSFQPIIIVFVYNTNAAVTTYINYSAWISIAFLWNYSCNGIICVCVDWENGKSWYWMLDSQTTISFLSLQRKCIFSCLKVNCSRKFHINWITFRNRFSYQIQFWWLYLLVFYLYICVDAYNWIQYNHE